MTLLDRPTDAPSRPAAKRRTGGGPYRFTREEYHAVAPLLREPGRVELLDGSIVEKYVKGSRHTSIVAIVNHRFLPIMPPGLFFRTESPVVLSDSEPEPDGSVVRGQLRSFFERNPSAAETVMVLEVSDDSLARDRGEKLRIYAAAGILQYWIINLIENLIEVYTAPEGDSYSQRRDYRTGDSVPLVLDGVQVAEIAVADLLP